MTPRLATRLVASLLLQGILLAPLVCSAALPIQHWSTAAGAQVYFVESHDLPMVDVIVEFPAGSARDTKQGSGLANLTLQMLRLGAGGMDEDQIARTLADTGANLSPVFDVDRAGYWLRTLSSEAEQRETLGVFARMLQAPSFPPTTLEREKARAVAALKESDTKPETKATRALAHLIFQDHPYAQRNGEPDTVPVLTRDDLVAFYRGHYNADRAVVAIMGDVTRARAEQIAEALTGGLPAGSAAVSGLPSVPALAGPVERDIEHPSTQAHIVVGQPGMRRNDPDYFPLWVGNYILGGGGFSSRLYEQVREKRGLSYSVYSYFAPYEQPGAFQVGLQTRGDQAQEALAVVRSVVGDFVARGPTQEELEAAKQNIVGGFALRIDSNRKIVEYLAVIGFYQLPLDYLDTFPVKVEAVTLEQIRDAFQRRIHPDRMATVVVGAKPSQ
ncbi:MAG TPA: pitrilysin family protein [Burkholderiales bacterium]|nr:pitrilysin family protein [Burkholderiales bacterium]